MVINEIHYNPAVPDTAFVELFNSSTNTIELGGWRLDGVDFVFPPGSVITNQQYLVVAADRYAFGNFFGPASVVAGDFNARLDNDGETLSLLRPNGTNAPPTAIDRVRFEAVAPWPDSANGRGPSLQLIDPTADNARVSNWSDGSGWRFFSFTGPIGSSRLSFLFDSFGGDVYLDDLALVPGTVPGAGVNSVVNGDFEAALAAPWNISGVSTNSRLDYDIKRSGAASLHLVQVPGTAGLTAFYQDVNPAVVTNATYTFSGWYRVGTNTTTNLTIRANTSFQVRPSLRPGAPTPGLANLGAGVLPPYPTVWLNEVMPVNVTGIADSRGDRDPWIELHNVGANPVSLDGFLLSDGYADLGRWAFPAGRVISPGGYMLVWMDGAPNESTPTELHASFRPAAGSGSVVLSRTVNGTPQILDYFNYAGVPANQAYGSVPDGQPFYRDVLYYPTPGAANDGRSAPLVVWINEWMAANSSLGGIADPADGDFEDWFELYNPGPAAVDLGGYFLTDNLDSPFQFEIPNNGWYRIPAGGFLLVWADAESGQNDTNRTDLHVNFSLRAAGEAIGLFAADGTRIDAVTFTNQLSNVSIGRSPDGSGNVVGLSRPSPRGANAGTLPPLAPVLGGVTLVVGGEARVRFEVQTEAGRSYQVEFTEELGRGWTPLGGRRQAAGARLLIEDTIGSARRFYRVVAE